jgi:apolipoprotein N-acyltransferase
MPSTGPQASRRPIGTPVGLALLAVAFVILSMSNGRFALPSAIWLGAPLALVGLRAVPLRLALAVGATGFMAVYIIQSMGVINLDPPISQLVGAGFGVVGFSAYAIDRMVSPRLSGVSANLVFPLALCSIEFATSRLSPYGAFGSIAYSQTTNLALLQILSVTGLWGVTLLVAWFASTIADLATLAHMSRRTLAPALVFLSVFVAVLGWGELRLAGSGNPSTVRVAAISPRVSDGFHFIEAVGDRCLDHHCEPFRARAALIQDELLHKTRREAMAGARIILWSEDAGTSFKAEEPAFVERGRALAREQRVTLIMALQVLTPGTPLAENKVVVAGPDGEIKAQYEKSRPVPGDPDLPGNGRIPTTLTGVGRVATAICFDLDFPPLMRQVGRSSADVIMAPASDWREIDPLHAEMAVFRGIENGASLVRATRRGLSIATDPYGRRIGTLDFFSTSDRTLIANIPDHGVRTIYALIGDLFDWLGVVGLAGVIAAAVSTRNSHRP